MERLQISVNEMIHKYVALVDSGLGRDGRGPRWGEGGGGGKCCKLAHVVRLDPIHLCNCDVSALNIS